VKAARLSTRKSARITPPLHVLCPGFNLGTWGVLWCSAHRGAPGEAAAVRGRVVRHGTQPTTNPALHPVLRCPMSTCTSSPWHRPAPCCVHALANLRQSYGDRHVRKPKPTKATQSIRTCTGGADGIPQSSEAAVGIQEERWLRLFATLRALQTHSPSHGERAGVRP
jgi:hypothetical protein